MARTTTAVSVRGDKTYTDKLNVLAVQRNKAVADLVRFAMDTVYGKELSEIPDILFAPSGKRNTQLETKYKAKK